MRVCVLWAGDAGQAREEVAAAAAGGMASKKTKTHSDVGKNPLNDPQSKPHRHRKNQEQIGDLRKEPLHE